MRHNVEGIPRGSLFFDGQPGQECTNGIVNRLLMGHQLVHKSPSETENRFGSAY